MMYIHGRTIMASFWIEICFGLNGTKLQHSNLNLFNTSQRFASCSPTVKQRMLITYPLLRRRGLIKAQRSLPLVLDTALIVKVSDDYEFPDNYAT